MAMGLFQSTVSRVRDLAHAVRELELTLCEPFDVPKEGHPYPATSPYSIASPPSISNRVLSLFNRVLGGPGSSYPLPSS